MPTPVVGPNLPEERLKVPAPSLLARHEQPCPRPQVHRPEDHPPGVAAAQPDLDDFAALRPSGAQRREQQKVGLVLGQNDAAPRQGPNLPADAAFFSRARGPGPGRIAAASTRSSVAPEPGEGCDRIPVVPWRSPGPRGAEAPSNSPAGSRDPGDKRRGEPPVNAPGRRPAAGDVPCLPRPPGTQGRGPGCKSRPIRRHSAESPRACGQYRRLSDRGRTPGRPASDETGGHPGSPRVDAGGAAVARKSG